MSLNISQLLRYHTTFDLSEKTIKQILRKTIHRPVWSLRHRFVASLSVYTMIIVVCAWIVHRVLVVPQQSLSLSFESVSDQDFWWNEADDMMAKSFMMEEPKNQYHDDASWFERRLRYWLVIWFAGAVLIRAIIRPVRSKE